MCGEAAKLSIRDKEVMDVIDSHCRSPKAIRPPPYINRLRQDFAGCNLLSLAVVLSARRCAIDDRKSLPAKQRRSFGNESVSNRQPHGSSTRHAETLELRGYGRALPRKGRCASGVWNHRIQQTEVAQTQGMDQSEMSAIGCDQEPFECERGIPAQPSRVFRDAASTETRDRSCPMVKAGQQKSPHYFSASSDGAADPPRQDS